MTGTVVAVSASRTHTFSKGTQPVIRLRTGLGVEGDAHAGSTVQHLSRVARNPAQPNLRQVHLLHIELLTELAERGFTIAPGDIGDNITTRDVPLLALPRGTKLHIGGSAVVELTGLRNPCAQLDHFQAGLMAAVLDRDSEGNLVRKAGVMAIVRADGHIRPDDTIGIAIPHGRHEPLGVV